MQNTPRVFADANVHTQAAVDGLGWTMADALMQREPVAPFVQQLTGYGYAILGSPARYANRRALELRNWLIEHG